MSQCPALCALTDEWNFCVLQEFACFLSIARTVFITLCGTHHYYRKTTTTMRRGVLMNILQQSAQDIPIWDGKPGEM